MAPAPTANRLLVLTGGIITCSLRDAGRAIGGYAFATTPLRPGRVPSAVGTGPSATERAKWSAEIYDFQPAKRGPLTYYDLIVNIGLSSQIKETAISGMLAVVHEVNRDLTKIPAATKFWDLPNADAKIAPRGSTLWHMWRAIELLDAVPGVGFTIAHKTLHHKRPAVFPLLDNETTRDCLPYDASWMIIHSDLTTQARSFNALEKWFAAEAAARKRPGLTRLRMHDIIVWLKVKGQWDDAVADGAKLGF